MRDIKSTKICFAWALENKGNKNQNPSMNSLNDLLFDQEMGPVVPSVSFP